MHFVYRPTSVVQITIKVKARKKTNKKGVRIGNSMQFDVLRRIYRYVAQLFMVLLIKKASFHIISDPY